MRRIVSADHPETLAMRLMKAHIGGTTLDALSARPKLRRPRGYTFVHAAAILFGGLAILCALLVLIGWPLQHWGW